MPDERVAAALIHFMKSADGSLMRPEAVAVLSLQPGRRPGAT